MSFADVDDGGNVELGRVVDQPIVMLSERKHETRKITDRRS